MEFTSKDGKQTLSLSPSAIEARTESGVVSIPIERLVKFMVSKKDPCTMKIVGRAAEDSITFHFGRESDAGLVAKSLNSTGGRVKPEPVAAASPSVALPKPVPGARGLVGVLESMIDPETGTAKLISEELATDLFTAMPSLAAAYESSVVNELTEKAFWAAVVEQYVCFKHTFLAEGAGGDGSGTQNDEGAGSVNTRAASLWVAPNVQHVGLLGAKRPRREQETQLLESCPSPWQDLPFVATVLPIATHLLPVTNSATPEQPPLIPAVLFPPHVPDVSAEVAAALSTIWDAINGSDAPRATTLFKANIPLHNNAEQPEVRRLVEVLARLS